MLLMGPLDLIIGGGHEGGDIEREVPSVETRCPHVVELCSAKVVGESPADLMGVSLNGGVHGGYLLLAHQRVVLVEVWLAKQLDG